MVAQLVQLKLRLLWNGLKADWQRRFGFPATMIALAVGAIFLAGRYLDTVASLTAEARIEFTLWGALGFFALWVTLPVVIFPLDENLDPAQFAMARLRGTGRGGRQSSRWERSTWWRRRSGISRT